jgi:hypothetical protein
MVGPASTENCTFLDMFPLIFFSFPSSFPSISVHLVIQTAFPALNPVYTKMEMYWLQGFFHFILLSKWHKQWSSYCRTFYKVSYGFMLLSSIWFLKEYCPSDLWMHRALLIITPTWHFFPYLPRNIPNLFCGYGVLFFQQEQVYSFFFFSFL